MTMQPPLKALIFNCSLKPSPGESSTDKLAQELIDAFRGVGVESTLIRAVDYEIKPGVELDMGEPDAWPQLRRQMIESDILVIATPTWVGHMTSVAQRIIERLDAELSETDDEGRLQTYGKVAAAVVVGNEDGAHKICGDIFQSLNDLGFTLATPAGTYWNGQAMHTTDYKDLSETPEPTAKTTQSLARNTAHLARLLKQHPYPPQA